MTPPTSTRARNRPRDERGSISIWLVTSSFVMMMLVGLAVDLGGQVHAKQRAHNIAAEAARAGAQQVQAAPAIQGQYVRVDAAAARTAAEQYLAAAGIEGTVTVTVAVSPTVRLNWLVSTVTSMSRQLMLWLDRLVVAAAMALFLATVAVRSMDAARAASAAAVATD